MNKCCVKNKECEHANSYGVCKLSSAYDCKKPNLAEYHKWRMEYLKNLTKEKDN